MATKLSPQHTPQLCYQASQEVTKLKSATLTQHHCFVFFPESQFFFFLLLLLLWPPLPHRSLASKDLLLCGSSSTSQELASWAWPASIPLCALQLFPILHSYPAIVSLQNQLPKASYFCLGNLFYCLITSLSGKFFLRSNPL